MAGGNTENEFIESLKANENNPTVNLDMEKLVRQLDLSTVYTYDGSLTTPTCDELVHFHLTTDVLPISDAQLAYFTDRWAGNSTFANGNGNNRKIQNLNGRTILKHSVTANIVATSAFGLFTTFFVTALLAFSYIL